MGRRDVKILTSSTAVIFVGLAPCLRVRELASVPEPDRPASRMWECKLSVSARVLGILRRSPSDTPEVASHPTWASLLVALTLVTATAGALVSATEVGQLALVDQWERTAAGIWPAGRRRPVRRICRP